MVDKLGDMAVVECSSQMLIIRKPEGNNNFLVSSNHFVDEKMINENANPEANWYHSYDIKKILDYLGDCQRRNDLIS